MKNNYRGTKNRECTYGLYPLTYLFLRGARNEYVNSEGKVERDNRVAFSGV